MTTTTKLTANKNAIRFDFDEAILFWSKVGPMSQAVSQLQWPVKSAAGKINSSLWIGCLRTHW